MNETEPRRRPLRSPSFVGRERELAELMLGLDDVRAGRGRLFLVAGEPGIGKTRLVEEVALEAARSGAIALWARCREWPGAPPFWPWIQALRDLVARASRERLGRWLGPGATSLTQLLPELRGRFADLEQPAVAADSEHGRFYLFDAVTNCLRSAAAETPLVLVFDDLQAADVSSLRLLEFVARELRSARLLVLGTHREPEIALPSVAESLALLGRDGERLPLRGLSEPEVRRFVEAVAGEPISPRLAQALHAETDGNPFFLDELVRVLAAEGTLGRGESSAPLGFPVPQGVRAAILRRISPLTEQSRELLALASVAGREFETVCLARAAELDEETLLETLHDAFAAGVLLRDAASFERLRFSHAQVREVLYDEIPPSRRVRLHRRIGEVLHALHRGNLDAHAAELAHHFLESAAIDDGELGVEYAERAARHAGAAFAYEEAIALYRGAL
ncbi:MAG: ATP-binding protein, partial [Candidatus Binatia bacterium]